MTNKEFTKVVKEMLQQTDDVLIQKGKEYTANSTDRLCAFKRGAEILRQTPENVLIEYMTKHIVSVFDMVNSEKQYPMPVWKEKLGDMINYCIILVAMEEEKNGDNCENS